MSDRYPAHPLEYIADTVLGVQNGKFDGHIFADSEGQIKFLLHKEKGQRITAVDIAGVQDYAKQYRTGELTHIGMISPEVAATTMDFMLRDDLNL